MEYQDASHLSIFFPVHSDPRTALPLQSFVNADQRILLTAVCRQFIHSLYLHQTWHFHDGSFKQRRLKPHLCFHTMTPGVNKHDMNRVTRVLPFLWCVCVIEERYSVHYLCLTCALCSLVIVNLFNVKRRRFFCGVNFPDCPCGFNKANEKNRGNKSASCLPAETKN